MGEPLMELGQGELAFEPLSDDEALPYVAGSQGGHHVFVSFRADNLDPKRMHVRLTTSVADHPELVLTREGRVNFSPAPGSDAGTAPPTPGNADSAASSSFFAGWPAQILLAPCHVGEAVLIEVTLTDLHMQSASDARTIRIAMPEHAAELDCPPDS
jgi:hypothetical protein